MAYTLEHMQVLAEAAGLICEPIDWPFRYFDPKQLWAMFTIKP